MIQANRADRPAGCIVGLHYHLHQADYWYVPFGRRGSCCTTCASARRPTARPRASTSGSPRRRPTTTGRATSRPGVAHGFAALTDMTITYLVDGYYNAADELGVAWDDPEIAADWGVDDPILSDRDRSEPQARRDHRPARPRWPTCAHEACSSPAAPGSSARTSCATGSRRDPDDAVVAFDALTYAGNRANLAGVDDRIEFVHGDIGDLDPRERRCSSVTTIDVIVNFAAESHNSLVRSHQNPGPLLPHQRARHADAARGRAGASASSASTTSRPARSTATSRSTTASRSPKTSPYRPRTPYNASKAGGDHAVRAYHETFGLPITITNCANNYGPYQFPEKVDPALHHAGARRQPLPLYASTREPARVDPRRSTTAARSTRRARAWPRRRDVPRRHRRRARSSSEIADARARRARQARVAEDDRARPARSRPALPARLRRRSGDELGWEPQVEFEAGLARDRRVVRGESRLVGTAARPCAGRGDAAGSAVTGCSACASSSPAPGGMVGREVVRALDGHDVVALRPRQARRRRPRGRPRGGARDRGPRSWSMPAA